MNETGNIAVRLGGPLTSKRGRKISRKRKGGIVELRSDTRFVQNL